MTDPVKLLLREPFSRFSRRYLKMVAAGDLTPGDLLILLFVADRTVSWRRLWEELSYSDFETGTGLTRKGIAGIVKRLVALDLLVRKRVGQSYAYALVPNSMTGLQVLASDRLRSVDNSDQLVTSGNQYQLPQVTTSADLSYIDPKKELRRERPPVDKGLKGKAAHDCADCHGEGWIVATLSDGFTEAVSRCPCVDRPGTPS
ncbi:MarR family transcriptional regulator [Rubrivirga litoralis]|uniref:Helix-turn-helix domain-containing protein n=1 Tax=Rubrivirga litoralis TaxID=3075598 RepID=A0ABU3BV76_9BACT|nr:helix-turn-helix domain-containing protein [Rubrivirga sp. F394]MDT0633190.1 helix-turn-helix domain-containing protein [Rubrivirga sp. F394]